MQKNKRWIIIAVIVMTAALLWNHLWNRTHVELDRGAELRSFFSRVVPADSLEVTTTEGPDGPRVLFSVKGAEKIADFIQRIRFYQYQFVDHCMCNGSMAITFYCGHVPLETITWHHGVSLRFFRTLFPTTPTRAPFISILPGNAELTGESAVALEEWFAENGQVLSDGETISLEERLQGRRNQREMLQKALADQPGPTAFIDFVETVSCRTDQVRAWLAETGADIQAIEKMKIRKSEEKTPD